MSQCAKDEGEKKGVERMDEQEYQSETGIMCRSTEVLAYEISLRR